MKVAIIKAVIQVVLWLILLGTGVWYLASSINGMSVPYASLPRFLKSIGACPDGVCDIASANGCFLCPYIRKLFLVIGSATERLWNAIIDHTWILLVIGLVIFMFWKAYEIITDANKENAALGADDRKFDFRKWFDPVKDQFIRVLIVCALLGAAGYGGGKVLQETANIVIYPVMSVGTSLSMAATGMGGAAACEAKSDVDNPMSSVSDSFMCVIGNLNAVILSGASNGFAMMGFAWQGLGGGFLSWLAGLAVVLIFLYVGFNVVFQILNVVFNLVFLIIFLPLLLAAYAFEKTWDMAKGAATGAIGILAQTAVRVIAITLNVLIFSSIVSYAQRATMSSDPAAEYAILEKCEQAAADEAGEIDKNLYKSCFLAERAANPTAFNYLYKGWEFLCMMLFLFFIYEFLIKKKLLDRFVSSEKDEYFKFGDGLKSFGQAVWKLPSQIMKKIPVGKGK
jgi:hypothetical protein